MRPNIVSINGGIVVRIGGGAVRLVGIGGDHILIWDSYAFQGQCCASPPLDSAIEKLDKYHLIILDDLCYVNRDRAETSVLFELIASRYEHRSLLITSNGPSEGGQRSFQIPP
jgi:hypothetical protein